MRGPGRSMSRCQAYPSFTRVRLGMSLDSCASLLRSRNREAGELGREVHVLEMAKLLGVIDPRKLSQSPTEKYTTELPQSHTETDTTEMLLLQHNAAFRCILEVQKLRRHGLISEQATPAASSSTAGHQAELKTKTVPTWTNFKLVRIRVGSEAHDAPGKSDVMRPADEKAAPR